MYGLSEPPAYVDGTLREHLARASELLADLRLGFLGFHDMAALEGACRRCMANLDALRIAGPASVRLGRSAMDDDADAASVVAFLLAESEGGADDAIALLRHPSPDIARAAWLGLRLADIKRIVERLRAMTSGSTYDFASAAALDVLAFHRQPLHVAPSGFIDADGDETPRLLAEAAGRTPGTWAMADLERYLGHPSRRVRTAALRASARSHLRELVGTCQSLTDRGEHAEAVEFLGVVGSDRDLARLQGVATSSASSTTIAKAAVSALGKLGLVAAMPTLLYLLDEAAMAESAAAAIARITGDKVARVALPQTPAEAREDELDFWDPVAPVDAAATREWWSTRAPHFDPKKRYQAGTAVSDDPLGPLFDRLPLSVRHDVYLRHRALVAGTPDWELETWTWRQKSLGG